MSDEAVKHLKERLPQVLLRQNASTQGLRDALHHVNKKVPNLEVIFAQLGVLAVRIAQFIVALEN